jgi:hypothetical protein
MNDLTNVQKKIGALFQVISTGSRCFKMSLHAIYPWTLWFSPAGLDAPSSLTQCRSIERRRFGRAMSNVVPLIDYKSGLLVRRGIFIGVS